MTWLTPYFAASLIGFTVYRRSRVLAFVVGLGAAAYPFVALVSLDVERDHTPVVYDAALTQLDGAIGHAVVRASQAILRASMIVAAVVKWAYEWNLPLALTLAALSDRRERLALALALAGALGLVCYLIFPAVGPGASADDYRNAMPSVHFAVTLLTAVALWRSGALARSLGATFVLVTAVATLGFREHYLVDLLAAVPFAAAVWLIATREYIGTVHSPAVTLEPPT
jgi:hypothetical protein